MKDNTKMLNMGDGMSDNAEKKYEGINPFGESDLSSKDTLEKELYYNDQIYDYQRSFVSNLERLAKQRGKNMTDISHAIGFNKSYLSQLITQDKVPSSQAVIKIAAVLNVEPCELLLPQDLTSRQKYLYHQIQLSLDLKFYQKLRAYLYLWRDEMVSSDKKD